MQALQGQQGFHYTNIMCLYLTNRSNEDVEAAADRQTQVVLGSLPGRVGQSLKRLVRP